MTPRWRRFRTMFGLEPKRDVEDELSFHLEMRVRELVEQGEPEARARELASRRFGDYEASRAACVAINQRRRRRMERVEVFTELRQDVRYALRMLRRAPGFTAIAVLTLALGIGANTAIFSLFNQLLLRSLPVQDPDRLVSLAVPGPKPGSKSYGMAGNWDVVFSYPMFCDLERVQTVFSGLAAHRDVDVNLTSRGETTQGKGMLVSGGYFQVLGLRPALGRLLGPDDDRVVGEPAVAVLSYDFWQARFGGSPRVLGDTVTVNGRPMTIVGVTPRGFAGTTVGIDPHVFVPLTMRWALLAGRGPTPDNRRAYWLYLFARRAPGVSLEQARTGINVPYRAILNDVEAPLNRGMSDQTLAQFKARTIQVDEGRRGQSTVFSRIQMPLTLLLGVTTLVLLIACVNIANLLLARAVARSSEIAMRLSIGATRGRLIAQLLTEAATLAVVGGAASLLVARWTLALVAALMPAEGAVRLPMQLDASALAVTAALAIGTSLLVGLFPALHATRPEVLASVKGQAAQAAGGRAAARFRLVLATAQIALSMVLVVLAGLFTKSLGNIGRADPGLHVENLVTFSISPERNGASPEQTALLVERLETELAAAPGVIAASSSRTPLLAGAIRADSAHVEGFEVGPDTDNDTLYDEIGPGFFRTAGIPLVAGREFDAGDSATATKVVIVNEEFTRKFKLGRNAVGKRMSRGSPVLDLLIVGLARDARHSDVKEDAAPMFFVPHRQTATRGSMSFYVRSSLPPEQAMAGVRQVVVGQSPDLPIEKLRTLQQQMQDETLIFERFVSVLTAAFAVLATLLAAIGLYGVLAYTVAQRTRELGLRIALGATRAQVRGTVLKQVAVMTLVGAPVGLAAAVAVAHGARALLFGLRFDDAGVLATAALLVTLVALAAGFVPADRAARIDPMRALKYD